MKTTRTPSLAITVITLLAFALRVYHLDGQSLWYDEGFSVYLSGMGLAEITARTAGDIQPPVYYYLLHAWMLVAGRSEFAVRFLSVVFGSLIIPLVYVFTCRLLGQQTALLAAFLIVISPFNVWYAQETRMYTLVTMLGVLSSWLLLAALDTDGTAPAAARPWANRSIWAAYALTNIVAIYAHYYAFFIVAFQAMFLAIWWLLAGRPAQTLRQGMAALLATILAYVPWAGFALNRYAVDESYWQGTLSLDFVRKTLLAFATGHTVFEAQAQAITAGYIVLALAGSVALVVHDHQTCRLATTFSGSAMQRKMKTGSGQLLFLVLYLAIPFLCLYLFSALRPKFNPRYLMLASPSFFILIAAGLAWLASTTRLLVRLVMAASLLFVVTTSGYALVNNYTNQVYVRDDFRSVAARIAADRQPDEAIILTSGHMFPVFDYYFKDGDVYRIPNLETLSTRAVLSYDVVDRLNEIAVGHSGVWLVLWQNEVVDPNGVLTALLDAQAQQVATQNTFWGIELRHYRFVAGTTFTRPVIAYPVDANIANKLTLLGYSLAGEAVPSGQPIDLTLYWQARQVLSEDYWLALRLVDAQGHIYGRLDRRPASYTYPTMRWQPGITIPGHALLPTLPGTPPGEYWLQVGVFDAAGSQNLDILDNAGNPAGVTTLIGTVQVSPPPTPPGVDSLGLGRMMQIGLGAGIELVATNLGNRTVRQGETIHFEIAWRNTEKIRQDYHLRLRLLTPDGSVVQDQRADLAGPSYPTTAWPAGSVWRGYYDLTIPADCPAQVQVEVSLDGVGVPQVLAGLEVVPVERVTIVPAIGHRQQARFGSVATLLGYDLNATALKAGQALTVTLYWQAGEGAAGSRSYSVFTHLLGEDRRIYGQHDGLPAEAARPTTGWMAGEVITDRHRIVVKPEATPGEYIIEVGLYDPLTDRRLEAVSEDGTRGDHVVLAISINVER